MVPAMPPHDPVFTEPDAPALSPEEMDEEGSEIGADPLAIERHGIAKRPTETATGLVLAGSIYGFLAEAGVANPVAGIIAIAIAFVPAALSALVDAWRAADPQVWPGPE